jgi:predicted small secreted protein
MHRALLRRGGAIVAIALALLLLAFVLQSCGNPMSGIDGLF